MVEHPQLPPSDPVARILVAIRAVHAGEVAGCGHIARRAGLPGRARLVARVLREHRLRVHDARIATFGERAEDMFQVSDEHDRPLHDDHQRQALRDALLAALDGDPR